MTARRILDAIADVVILAALVVAGIGQFMPWMGLYHPGRTPDPTSAIKIALSAEASPASDLPTTDELVEFQMWHVTRSGAALAVAGVLVLLSLALNLGAAARKLLVVLMFASLAAAICFEVMIYTPLPITPEHVTIRPGSAYGAAGVLGRASADDHWGSGMRGTDGLDHGLAVQTRRGSSAAAGLRRPEIRG